MVEDGTIPSLNTTTSSNDKDSNNESEYATIILVRYLPIVLIATLSVLYNVGSRPRLGTTMSTKTNRHLISGYGDGSTTSRVSCQVALLLCVGIAHVTVVLQPIPPKEGTNGSDARWNSSTTLLWFLENTNTNGAHEQRLWVYYESLLVVCSYLPVVVCILESTFYVAVRAGIHTTTVVQRHRSPFSSSSSSSWSLLPSWTDPSATSTTIRTTTNNNNTQSIQRRRRRKLRHTLRRIEMVIRPFPIALLSTLYAVLSSLVSAFSSSSSLQSDPTPHGILRVPIQTFLISYTLLLLFSRVDRYRAFLQRLFPPSSSSSSSSSVLTQKSTYQPRRNIPNETRQRARTEATWYQWTDKQFRNWVLEVAAITDDPQAEDRERNGGEGSVDRYGSATTTHSTTTRGANQNYHSTYESDSDSEDEIQDEDTTRTQRLRYTLTPHRIYGSILPQLLVSDWVEMGLVYGDAVWLDVQIRELMGRVPLPDHLRNNNPSDGFGPGAEVGGVLGRDKSNGIDLEGWLNDGIGESRPRRRDPLLPAMEYGRSTRMMDGTVRNGGVDVASIGGVQVGGSGSGSGDTELTQPQSSPLDMEKPAMERAQEIMSERFGMSLPQLRTAAGTDLVNNNDDDDDDDDDQHGGVTRPTKPPPPPPLQDPTIPIVPKSILDSMPPEIQAIAQRNPDLVSTILLQQQSQPPPPPLPKTPLSTPTCLSSTAAMSLDNAPTAIREIASRRPDLVNALLQQQQQQQNRPSSSVRPRAPLREHLRSPRQIDYIKPPKKYDVIRENGRSKKDDGYLSRVEEGKDEGAEEGEEEDLLGGIIDDGDETVGLLRKRRVGSNNKQINR